MKKDRLKETYGLTSAEYDVVLAWQKKRCAICGKHQSEVKYSLHVDHDHKTGKVRGILCAGCNTGLGYFEKNHQKYQDYLDAHKKAQDSD